MTRESVAPTIRRVKHTQTQGEPPMQYQIISLALAQSHIARLHVAGCADVAKDRQLGNVETIEAANANEAAANYIAGELDDMGYSVADVKIVSCAR